MTNVVWLNTQIGTETCIVCVHIAMHVCDTISVIVNTW